MLARSAFQRLRRTFRSANIDAEGYWSYPSLLYGRGGRLLWLYIVLVGIPLPAKKRTALFRPKSLIVTLPNSATIIEYRNLKLGPDPFPNEGWDKPIAMYPHKGIWSMTIAEFAKAEAVLMASYEQAGSEFVANQQLPASFRRSYIRLQHPIMLDYVRCLAPDFFRALQVDTVIRRSTAKASGNVRGTKLGDPPPW